MNIRIMARILAAGAVALAASACVHDTSGRAAGPTTPAVMTTPARTPGTYVVPPTNAPTTTTPKLQPGPHSWVGDVDLPEGTVQCTTFLCSNLPHHDPHDEFWRYNALYDDVVAFLRERFATGRRYDAHGATWWKGLPPCYDTAHQSPPWGWSSDSNTHWAWSDDASWLEVTVHKAPMKLGTGETLPFGVIVIDNGTDPGIVAKSMCYRA